MHVDNAIRTHAATAMHVRTDISCMLFLSNPASYDGGEQLVKFDAGDLVMYPDNSVHRVEPVTCGERLACFFWIENMVRLDAQRQLLHDMDMSPSRHSGKRTGTVNKATHDRLRLPPNF